MIYDTSLFRFVKGTKFEKCFFLLFLCYGIYFFYGSEKRLREENLFPINQKIEGSVVFIDWESWNHLSPLITIEDEIEGRVVFNHYTIILNEDSLKVGDFLFKESGSKLCKVNNVEIKCLK